MDPSDYSFGWPDDDEVDDYDDYDAESEPKDDHGQISSLQEICLLAVLENFDRFCVAFKMRNSKVPKMNWEFLARRYSEKIFEELKMSGKLKSEHLDLLISPHTKTLDICEINEEILPYLIERLKKTGTNILTFKARCRDIREDIIMSLMKALPKVEEIDYSHEEFFNSVETKSFKQKLLRLGKMSATKYFSHVPQICQAIGQNCRSLKRLTFHYDNFSDMKRYNEGLAFILKNCSCLETVQYKDTVGALYMLHKSDLRAMKVFRKSSLKTRVKYVLKNLSSENRYYPLLDALEICVTTCPRVSRLHIDFLDKDEELELISHFSDLEDIKFETMGVISPSCLGKFLNLKGSKFTTLELPYRSGLPIETLIECCPKLQSLKLSYVELSTLESANEQSSSKASLNDLETLEFTFTDFVNPGVDDALKLIASSAKNLKELSLNGSSGLTDKVFRSLNLRNICVLDASNSDVAVDSLNELLLHGSLQTLIIMYCEKLSHDDYFTLTRCVAETNKNVEIQYRPVRSSRWGNFVSCCMAYIP